MPKIFAVAVFAATMMGSLGALAQNTTSTLVGLVKDDSGAALAGASVHATNIATNVVYSATTNNVGEYRISQLPPGTYKMQVTSAGFQALDVQPFTLSVDQQARQDVSLKVGSTSQTVSVTADNLLVDTENATEGQVVENRQIEDLPLNGRDYLQLAQLAAGVTPIDTNQMVSPASGFSNSASGAIVLSINGLREDDISYLYDGIETRNGWYGAVGIRPSLDDIQEFKVERTGSSAAYGAGGAFVNVVTKSGTNTLHGSAFEFLRNNILDARNYFDVGAKPVFRQNQFGGSLGGPILKSKLFFFVNYEGFRQARPVDAFTNVPTSAEEMGDFSALLPNKQLMNPFTGTPFAGNIIPSSMFNSTAAKVFAFYPAPNGSFIGGTNFFKVVGTTDTWDQVTGRFDYAPSSKDAIYGRYTWLQEFGNSPGIDKYSGNAYPDTPQNLSVGWVHTFSSRVLNDARFGWNHSQAGQVRQFGYDSAYANPLGLQNPANQAGSYGLPTLAVNGYGNPGPGQGSQTVKEGIYMGTDTLSMQRGKHALSFGLDIRYNPVYMYEDWAAASISFSGNYTGDAVADLLLGIPQSAGTAIGDPTLNFRRWYQSYFVQDDIKVNSRLTVNAGVRWEYNQPPVETHNRVGTFDTATGVSLTYPATKTLGLSRAMVRPDYKNFSPRVGLAWRPFGERTVVRAGGGMYYLQANYNQYEQEVDTPLLYLDYSFSNGAVGQPLTFTTDQLFQTNQATPFTLIAFENPNNKTPYAYEASLSIEQTFHQQWLWEVGYFGSFAHHYALRPNINAPLPDGTTPYQNYTGGILEGLNEGSSNYHALSGKLEKRFSSGLSLLGTYTWSKCLGSPWTDEFTLHPYDLALDYGHCTYDITQRLVVSGVYELPIGKGRRYLNQGGVANAVLGGWKVSEIANFSTGPWVSLGSPQYTGTLVGSTPNVIGPINNATLRRNIRKDGLGPYFNVGNVVPITACCGIQGDAARNSVIAPGTNNWDLSLAKDFSLAERSSLAFRADFFNAFNHGQFNGLDTFTADPSFGFVTSARDAREIQFSLRLEF